MMNPELYARNNQIQRPAIAEVIDKFLPKIKWRPDNKDTLIDIGSGTGAVLMELVCPMMGKKFERIVCTDLSPNMVNYAKSHYRHVEKSEFIVLDAGTELALPDTLKGQFDHVVSFHCIHFVQNQMKAFENICQLLRPNEGGDCILNIFARGPYYDVCLALSKTPQWSEYMTEIKKYTCYWHLVKNPEEEARFMLEKCGFVDIEVNVIGKCMIFDTEESIREMLLAVSPFIDGIPKERQQDFLTDTLELWGNIDKNFRVPLDSGAKFCLSYEQIEIFARRPPITT